MAITHRFLVLATFPLCCVSVAILATSMATNYWLHATSIFPPESENENNNTINYGLFNGLHEKYITLLTPRRYAIKLTCLSDEGKCAWSCLATADERKMQVRQLVENGSMSLNQTCPNIPFAKEEASSRYRYDALYQETAELNVQNNLDETKDFDVDQRFISLGLWASTVAFLSLAILMATIGAAFAVVNTAGNPVEPILGVPGLFAWNAIAAVGIIMTLILWGAQFGITLVHNVALPETISGANSSEGLAQLGWSYWLLMGSLVLHALNIGLLLFRRHLISTEPPTPTVHMDKDPDGAIFLY